LYLKIKRMFAIITAAISVLAMLGSATLFSSVALADSSLRRGDSGKDVEELQRLLKEHDCYDFDEITGYFGATTEDGVRKFQTLNGLKVDGVAGADTLALLKQKKVKPKDPDSLCLGMSGSKVEEIQKRLKDLGLYTETKVTGYFGPATEEAVKAFQEASGIPVDGIVGKKTKAAMFAPFKSTTMVPGMKGDNVTSLQNRLSILGYYEGPITGLYGQLTQQAVKYFQQLNGLKQDGVCGKTTYSAVFSKSAKTEKDARRAPAPTPKPSPTYTDAPGQSAHGQEMGQAVVAFAKLQLGKKYVYGTEGPNTFDCSGLTWYVYKHFGVTIPRGSTAQGNTNYGIKITSKSKFLPGDLVFFHGRNGVIGHAAIYVGNMSIIEAPYSGATVRIRSIANSTMISWGRRVFQ
jgi:peptidoglycan hydrolase-like protein with peptidoglycan-binding domain